MWSGDRGLPSMLFWVQSPIPHNLGMGVPTCNPGTHGVKVEGSFKIIVPNCLKAACIIWEAASKTRRLGKRGVEQASSQKISHIIKTLKPDTASIIMRVRGLTITF